MIEGFMKRLSGGKLALPSMVAGIVLLASVPLSAGSFFTTECSKVIGYFSLTGNFYLPCNTGACRPTYTCQNTLNSSGTIGWCSCDGASTPPICCQLTTIYDAGEDQWGPGTSGVCGNGCPDSGECGWHLGPDDLGHAYADCRDPY